MVDLFLRTFSGVLFAFQLSFVGPRPFPLQEKTAETVIKVVVIQEYREMMDWYVAAHGHGYDPRGLRLTRGTASAPTRHGQLTARLTSGRVETPPAPPTTEWQSLCRILRTPRLTRAGRPQAHDSSHRSWPVPLWKDKRLAAEIPGVRAGNGLGLTLRT